MKQVDDVTMFAPNETMKWATRMVPAWYRAQRVKKGPGRGKTRVLLTWRRVDV